MLTKEGRYRQRVKQYRQNRTYQKQYRQNRTFQINERQFYPQLGGSDTKTCQQPDAKETERFWTKTWQQKRHNENAEWINNITRELDGPKTEIHIDLLKKTLKRISNWKTPGHDGMHGFWFKKFTSIHGRLALEINRYLQGAQVPLWMTKKDCINPKGSKQRNCPKQSLTNHLSTNDVENTNSTNKGKDLLLASKPRIVPWTNQKDDAKDPRGTAELLYIDQHILNESKTKRKNLAIAWIDYKMAYDMVPQSWIIHCLKMYKISHEVI